MASRGGFSLVEVLVSLAILTTVILSMGGASARFARGVTDSGVRASALQLAEDRIEEVRMHPRYGEIEDVFEGAETDVQGLTGTIRMTEVTPRADTLASGVIDYTTVTVRVLAPGLTSAVSRTTIVGAP